MTYSRVLQRTRQPSLGYFKLVGSLGIHGKIATQQIYTSMSSFIGALIGESMVLDGSIAVIRSNHLIILAPNNCLLLE